MKRSTLVGLAIALTLLLAVGGMFSEGSPSTSVVRAQDATAVPTTVAEPTTVVQTTQPVQREDDNGFPWGLLGLLGLGGLAGLRRQPEPVQQVRETVAPKVGMYDNPKK